LWREGERERWFVCVEREGERVREGGREGEGEGERGRERERQFVCVCV
jgi:hypothetical protein